ncbi:MAG: pilus assembly protein FimV [Pseudomonadales bacterium]|jgi:pilus assembly protein FimV
MSLHSESRQRKAAMCAFVLAASLVFPAGLVNALGLGEIKVDSELNQPMDGKIKLTNLGDYAAEDIRVRMASLADFDRSGVEMMAFLLNLKFETIQDANGAAIISVSSKELVQEPYLNFVVEAYWPDGRVLREYTVLLDLPLYAAEEVDTEAFKQAKSAPAVTETASSPSRFNPGLSGNRYTVGTEDTLWGIARQVTPNGATIQQTMIAIQRDNPNAFRNDNINQLRHGAVLDLPSAQEVAALDGQMAIQEVRQQNQSWRDQSLTNVPLDASKSANYNADAGSNTGGKLSLASGGTSRASSIGDRPNSKASADLVVTKERLDEQSRQNQQLESRMVELQEQMGTLQTLIELKDNQISRLQSSELNDQASTGETVSGEPVVSALDTVMPEPVETEKLAEPKPAKKQPVVPEEPSLIDTLMVNLSYILAALLAIVLGVYFFIKLRGGAKADDSDDDKEEYTDDEDEEWDDFDVQVDQAAVVDESPVIAEAQALIEAGNTVKAISTLETAVGKEPHRSDIRLKLLAVLADNNIAKQFKVHYLGLKAIGSDDDIAEASNILANTDGAEDWLAQAKDSKVSAAEKFSEMDYDAVGEDEGEIGFDSTGDLGIEDLDMASISADGAELDDDLGLDDFDSEIDEISNGVAGLDEDLDDDFSADLLATKEGGEGVNDLPDLEDLLGLDDLDESDVDLDLTSDAELSLDDDFDLDDDGTDTTEGVALNSDDELDEEIDLGDDFDFDLDDDDDFGDEVEDDIGTRLELAKAYVELGDEDGAKEILSEVMNQGSNEQKAEAKSLLESL